MSDKMRAEDFPQQAEAALLAVEEYFDAFNARDPERFAKALHYPHTRIDGLGNPTIWNSWVEYEASVDFDRIVATGWHHTTLDWKKIVQIGRDKVHVTVAFTRFDEHNTNLLTQESLYVVTHQEDRWAISVRSSFLEQAQRRR